MQSTPQGQWDHIWSVDVNPPIQLRRYVEIVPTKGKPDDLIHRFSNYHPNIVVSVKENSKYSQHCFHL